MYLSIWIGIVLGLYFTFHLIARRVMLRYAPKLYSVFWYVSVWIHELSHAIFALATFHRIHHIEVHWKGGGKVVSSPIGRPHSGVLGAIMLCCGPILMGAYGVFTLYQRFLIATSWQENLVIYGLCFTILTAVLPSRPDMEIIWRTVRMSLFDVFLQIFSVTVVCVIFAVAYPVLYWDNKTSLYPLLFLAIGYGAFLLEYLLQLFIQSRR